LAGCKRTESACVVRGCLQTLNTAAAPRKQRGYLQMQRRAARGAARRRGWPRGAPRMTFPGGMEVRAAGVYARPPALNFAWLPRPRRAAWGSRVREPQHVAPQELPEPLRNESRRGAAGVRLAIL
jgi:hypothetical protein